MLHHLDQYDPMHRGGMLAHQGRSLARQFDVDPDNPSTYSDLRWHALITRTDQIRWMGETDIAESQYLDILAALRRAQGATSDVAYMLDYLAEFYLEQRKFDQAYASFTEAVHVRQQTLEALTKAEGIASTNPELLQREVSLTLYSLQLKDAAYNARTARLVCQTHLMDLLTRLAQLDMAKDDWVQADQKLAEAVKIANSSGVQSGFVTNTVYFRSIVLEHQNKWSEAEQLWKDSLHKVIGGKNALKEFAAFYARHGDLATAAQFARDSGSGLSNGQTSRGSTNPYALKARPWIERYESIYQETSDAAMRQILALDAWRSQGADAAAAILKHAPTLSTRYVFDHGSDAERLQMLKWQTQVVSLQMSILLDGTPSDDNIRAAYALVGEIKGRFLATIDGRVRGVEAERGNPKIQDPVGIGLLDQLIETRQRRAHRFVSAVFDGQALDASKANADDNMESLLSTALISDAAESAYRPFPAGGPSVPQDAVFIEMTVWNRSNKDPKLPAQRVYGAFIVRTGEPVKYVDLGPAASIDNDLGALEKAYVPGSTRAGDRADVPTAPRIDREAVRRSLYRKVIRPLEAALGGAKKLYVAPDGALALAPIGIFLDDEGRSFLETHTMTYLSSWRELKAPTAGADASAPSAIVANPDFDAALDASSATRPVSLNSFATLPNFQVEADEVQKVLKVPKDRVLIGRYARKSSVESLSSPQILHFATHSTPFLHLEGSKPVFRMMEYPQAHSDQDPLLQSVIALAGANRQQSALEDGWLTGLDVSTLRLSGTQLVVLSSCSAARGTPTDGQGVQGLRSAFAMAGARSLVMSLWPINDEAGTIFMQLFYSHLSEGPAVALQRAQTEIQTKAPQFKDVVYWGGYVLSGQAGMAPVPLGSATAVAGPSPPTKSTTNSSVDAGSVSSLTQETLVHPSCFRFASHEGKPGAGAYTNLLQIKIGGSVRRIESSATRVVYDLPLPGNDILEKTYDPRIPSVPVERKQASRSEWIMTMTLEKDNKHSLIAFQFGSPRFPAEQRRTLTFEGPPGLLKSLDIPEVFPPLSSFTKSSDDFVTTHRVIDNSGACTSDFWEQ